MILFYFYFAKSQVYSWCKEKQQILRREWMSVGRFSASVCIYTYIIYVSIYSIRPFRNKKNPLSPKAIWVLLPQSLHTHILYVCVFSKLSELLAFPFLLWGSISFYLILYIHVSICFIYPFLFLEILLPMLVKCWFFDDM